MTKRLFFLCSSCFKEIYIISVNNRCPFLGNPFLPNFRIVAPQIGISALLWVAKLPQWKRSKVTQALPLWILSAVQGPVFLVFGGQGWGPSFPRTSMLWTAHPKPGSEGVCLSDTSSRSGLHRLQVLPPASLIRTAPAPWTTKSYALQQYQAPVSSVHSALPSLPCWARLLPSPPQQQTLRRNLLGLPGFVPGPEGRFTALSDSQKPTGNKCPPPYQSWNSGAANPGVSKKLGIPKLWESQFHWVASELLVSWQVIQLPSGVVGYFCFHSFIRLFVQSPHWVTLCCGLEIQQLRKEP